MSALHEAAPFDVFCAADLCIDLILTGNVVPQFHQVEQLIGDYHLDMGGSAPIFACQFAKLGGRAGVIGKIGTDLLGQIIVQRLTEADVDVTHIRHVPTLKTGIGVALNEVNDRAILTYLGSINALEPEDFADSLKGITRHWHLASYFLLTRLRGFWPEWLKGLRRQGVTTSLDTNWDPDNQWTGVPELLRHIDVFLPNEAEAMAIAKKPDVHSAGRALAELCPLVVIKTGGDGAVAFASDRVCAAGIPDSVRENLQIADAVGAGDSFDAGFLRAWQRGQSIEESLLLGIRCGCANLRAAGGVQSQLIERESPA
jgi:ribokinase